MYSVIIKVLFLWGYVKDIMYQTKIRDINDLKQRITDAIATIDEAMLQRTWQEIYYSLEVLRATNGAHREVYYMRQKNFNIYSSFCNNFHRFIYSFAFVINSLNSKET